MIRHRGKQAYRDRSATTRCHSETCSAQKIRQQEISLHENWLLLTYAPHFLSVALFVAGVILSNIQLKTHDECDMTFSRRHFVQLHLWTHQNLTTSHNYRVFQFFDERDPRFVQLQKQTTEPLSLSLSPKLIDHYDDSATQMKWWCSHPLPIVVYVPGHGGSYEQSRSLGAHGTQLTRRHHHPQQSEEWIRELRSRGSLDSSRRELSVNNFFYDVVALDFREEGAGFHGAFVERQAKFLAQTVEQLSNLCDNHIGDNHRRQISIVAHSIGGISTRLALLLYSRQMSAAKNVVTLGTPHVHPILSWEPHLYQVYQSLHNTQVANAHLALISISGGLRDEMIPPAACYVNDTASLTLMANDIMPNGTVEAQNARVYLGMDHSAMVWCHNLLSQVRRILFALQQDDDKYNHAAARIERVRAELKLSKRYSYHESIAQIPVRLRHRYGFWFAWFFEMGLRYRAADILVTAYTILGACYYLQNHVPRRPRHSIYIKWISPVAFAILYSWRRHETRTSSIASIVLLAFVADAVRRSLEWVLPCTMRGCRISTISPNAALFKIWLGGVVLMITSLTALPPNGYISIVLATAVYYLAGDIISRLPRFPLLSSNSTTLWRDRQVSFVVWVIILFALVVFAEGIAATNGLVVTTTRPIKLAAIPICIRLWAVFPVDNMIVQNNSQYVKNVRAKFYLMDIAATLVGCWMILETPSVNNRNGWWPFHPLLLLPTMISILDLLELTYVAGTCRKVVNDLSMQDIRTVK